MVETAKPQLFNKPFNKPLNIAHRGGANLWPENTLEAFRQAIAIGADGIELDVQLSADGRLMVHHDAHLKPEATRLGGVFLEKPTPRIDQLTHQDLAQYDVGRLDPTSAYGKRRKHRQSIDGARIPTLDEVDRLISETAPPDFLLYTELKTDMQADPRQAHMLAEAYLAALDTSPIAARHNVISFDWRCINAVRVARPNMGHAYTTLPFNSTDPDHPSAADDATDSQLAHMRRASKNGAPWFDKMDWRDMQGGSHGEKVLRAIHAGGGTGWFGEWHDVSADMMACANALGLGVSAWTVNRKQNMHTLGAQGVAALITDRPDILSKL